MMARVAPGSHPLTSTLNVAPRLNNLTDSHGNFTHEQKTLNLPFPTTDLASTAHSRPKSTSQLATPVTLPRKMSTSCTFLDKLPAEIRAAIYDYTFGPSRVIKPKNSTASLGISRSTLARSVWPDRSGIDSKWDITLDTAVLTTCKVVFEEAINVLYRDTTVRGTMTELAKLLENDRFKTTVRQVEVADCINGHMKSDFYPTLNRLQSLPQICSVAILTDCLNHVYPMDVKQSFVTVKDFCETTCLGPTTCADIGRYKLAGMFHRVELVNRKLVHLWRKVQDMPADYDAFGEFEEMMDKWPSQSTMLNRAAWVLQTSFCCWVGLHDETIKMVLSGELEEPRNQATFFESIEGKRRSVVEEYTKSLIGLEPFLPEGLTEPGFSTSKPDVDWRTMLLRQIKPGANSSVLEWANDYLSRNIAAFIAKDATYAASTMEVHAAHWAEADGGTHTIEHKLSQERLAYAGIANLGYILDPIRDHLLIVLDSAQSWIDQIRIQGLMGTNPFHAAYSGLLSYDETRQLTYLAHALMPDYGRHGYEEDLEAWSSDLLKRYVLVTAPSEAAKLHEVGLTFLRGLFFTVLDLLKSAYYRHRAKAFVMANENYSEPPKDIDDDLYKPLAWKFGRLLSSVWRGDELRGLEDPDTSSDGDDDDGDDD